MPAIQAERSPTPTIVPTDTCRMTDDERVERLARALEVQEFGHLHEVVRLIVRLAVSIE